MRWSDALRHLRRAAGLSQAELARRASLSVESLSLYERGKRVPARETLVRLAEALNADRRTTNGLLDALGFEPLPEGTLAAIEAERPRLDEIQRAIDTYSWPVFIGNEQAEVVRWNEPTTRVAEMNFAVALPQPYQRHLLRISTHPNFYDPDPARRRVVNWEEIVTVLISMLKAAGQDLGQPTADAPYIQKLVQDVSRDHPQAFAEVARLWFTTSPLRDLPRVTFPAAWRLRDGIILQFHVIISIWSEFDGAWAFDWFPADGATWDWLGDTAPPVNSTNGRTVATLSRAWWEVLRDARTGTGLSRGRLAALAHVSEELVEKYERGRSRRPAREYVLALTRALDTTGTLTNAILEGAGLAPEPSDLARTLAGIPPRTAVNIRFQQERPSRLRLTHIQRTVAAHPWPVALFNPQGVIVYCNLALQRVVGHDDPGLIQSMRRQHLLRFITHPRVAEHLVNWAEVAPALAPPPFRSATAPESPYNTELLALRERHPAMARRIEAVWAEAAPPVLANRAVVRLRWRLESGPELAFHCVVARWEQNHPYWAIDWHPADGATWDWLGGG
jgi:transcriptional regulator with XRE-family HTH domain